ncbi:restriction endonuclease subunit S [Claveliimonas bilis]|uniref:Restriction endonuclease subunit S n=1 Tax=Claveliimonas bilis TaxID=3028070 RepID=A0ABM8I5S3_9FIRM|nr:restriction endonuclease subunit S [Claveliimonas bilis]BDZ78483.1 restriction endonuclease subunit S [Claveliimonas bilis]
MSKSDENKRRVPKLRFPGFTEDWEQRKLGELGTVQTCKRIFKEQTSEHGDIPFFKNGTIGLEPDSYISREVYEEFRRLYPYPEVGDTLISVVGSIGRTAEYKGKDEYFQDSNVVWLKTDGSINKKFLKISYQVIKWLIEGSTVKHLYNDNILRSEIVMPLSQKEQAKIAAYFDKLDHLITLHQRKCDRLKELKKGLLQKMFPKNGEKIPELRFPGFTEDWEQRKFSDLVLIERGGSPRPIDDYITDAPNGLNWVKIGDAPEQGRYITKTVEKIKPEGLSKTRQVQPGDLILSNSMSFGKPYIMGINGCIHDGWLLIRDTQSRFDLKFLCHMLGTEQMLNQYRMFAAGSTVNNLNKELVGNTTVSLPSIEEQRVIGDYLENIDHLITLHQRKLDHLKELKKGLLQQMFV